jgi:hypothetical protein
MYGNSSVFEQCTNRAEQCCCKSILSLDNILTSIPVGIILGVSHGVGLNRMWESQIGPEKTYTFGDIWQLLIEKIWQPLIALTQCGTSSSTDNLLNKIRKGFLTVWRYISKIWRYISKKIKEKMSWGMLWTFYFPLVFKNIAEHLIDDLDDRSVESINTVSTFSSTIIISLMFSSVEKGHFNNAKNTVVIGAILCFAGDIISLGHMPFEESGNYIDRLKQPHVVWFIITLLICSFTLFICSFMISTSYLWARHFCQVFFLMTANKLTYIGSGIIPFLIKQVFISDEVRLYLILLFVTISLVVSLLIFMKSALHFTNPVHMAALMCGSDGIITTLYSCVVYGIVTCSITDNAKLIMGLFAILLGLKYMYTNYYTISNGYLPVRNSEDDTESHHEHHEHDRNIHAT